MPRKGEITINNKLCNLLLVTISEHKRIHDKLRAEARVGKGAVTC